MPKRMREGSPLWRRVQVPPSGLLGFCPRSTCSPRPCLDFVRSIPPRFPLAGSLSRSPIGVAPVAEGAEAGHVPDLAIAGVVVVRVELTFVEEPAARRAAIVILAATVHRHDLADEGRGRVETEPAPLSARGAALEAARPSFRPGPGQAADLIGRRLAAALGQVAKDVPALAAMLRDERVESVLARLELHGVSPPSDGLEESSDED